ncbi:MAG: hypothetical protein ACP5UV_01525, partial [Thermoplasmata archaeon]
MQIKGMSLKRIGIIVIVVSLVIFTMSMYQMNSDSLQSDQYLAEGHSVTLAKEASTGDYISFYVIYKNSSTSLSTYLSSPSGTEYVDHFSNYGNTTGSIIGNQNGQWYLHIKNTGTVNTTIDVYYEAVPYYVIAAIFVGFVLLP